MNNFGKIFIRLVKEDSGQDLIEYALVAALIALGAVAAMGKLGGIISTAFGNVGNQLTSATA